MDFPGDVLAAHDRIRDGIRRTLEERSEALESLSGAERVFVKWEGDQITGSFKIRGALNKIRGLAGPEKRAGVVAASTGNHGLAVATAARMERIEAALFLPENADRVKREKIQALGVSPRLFGRDCEKTEIHARAWAAEKGRTYISPYNDPEVVAGQGTVALEILDTIPRLDAVLVPVGGGGLIAGIAGVIKAGRAGARIYGVEPEASAFMKASVDAGRLVGFPEKPTIAGAVAGGIEPGSITFPLCRDLLDGFILVSEEEIAGAMRMLYDLHGRMVEGAGALAVAGLLAGGGRFRGRQVVCVSSGSNIDSGEFGRITGRA